MKKLFILTIILTSFFSTFSMAENVRVWVDTETQTVMKKMPGAGAEKLTLDQFIDLVGDQDFKGFDHEIHGSDIIELTIPLLDWALMLEAQARGLNVDEVLFGNLTYYVQFKLNKDNKHIEVSGPDGYLVTMNFDKFKEFVSPAEFNKYKHLENGVRIMPVSRWHELYKPELF